MHWQKQCFLSFKSVVENASENYIYLMQIQMSVKKTKEAEEKQNKKRKKINALNHTEI